MASSLTCTGLKRPGFSIRLHQITTAGWSVDIAESFTVVSLATVSKPVTVHKCLAATGFWTLGDWRLCLGVCTRCGEAGHHGGLRATAAGMLALGSILGVAELGAVVVGVVAVVGTHRNHAGTQAAALFAALLDLLLPAP